MHSWAQKRSSSCLDRSFAFATIPGGVFGCRLDWEEDSNTGATEKFREILCHY